MLEELDQNIEMTDAKKHKLSIHHSNLYFPDPMGITNIAKSLSAKFVAITKEHIHPDPKIAALTIIEVYQVKPYMNPKLVQRLFEYECLTGIAWISDSLLLTVSRDQTINIYNINIGSKVNSTMTDYGPIWCMKYDVKTELLLTGTEYGYIASYRVGDGGETIVPMNKMVKINDKILALDMTCRPRDKVVTKKETVKHRKRKRTDSSDESDEAESEEEYLASTEITIYGASVGNVIAWDYHKRTIIETMHIGDDPCLVLSVLALKNGDIAAGDSSGTLSIFDHKSLTCRMTANVLQSAILSLAENKEGSLILVSGRDPTIVMMKRDKLEPSNFLLAEKFELHTHDVTGITFLKKTNFFTISLDGILAKFRLKLKSEKSLEKYITNTGYHNNIKFADGEMMIQNKRSLTIWKLPKASSPRKNVPSQDQSKPVKSLMLRTRDYIHASTFSDRWISYSTHRGLYIYDRSEAELRPYRPDKKLPDCNALELCCNRRLAVSAQRSLYIIDLMTKDQSKDEGTEEKLIKCIVSTHSLGSNIKQMVYFEPLDQLVVACSYPKNCIYLYNLNPTLDKEVNLKEFKKFPFGELDISFLTYNAAIKRDPNMYIYTNNDQIIKFDVTAEEAEPITELAKKDRVSGLPEDADILGMLLISREHCILYDKRRMFKVDMARNMVINLKSDYNLIVGMDNFLFHKPEQVALVELKPEDYLKLLPPTHQKRKFGDV